jgi:hypothetical protein
MTPAPADLATRRPLDIVGLLFPDPGAAASGIAREPRIRVAGSPAPSRARASWVAAIASARDARDHPSHGPRCLRENSIL